MNCPISAKAGNIKLTRTLITIIRTCWAFITGGTGNAGAICFVLCALSPFTASGQQWLDKPVSVQVKNVPVKDALSAIAQQGGFQFSYSADLIPGDSIVSVSAHRQPARKVLHSVLGGRFQFKEAGRFVIIQRVREERYGYITGRVLDGESRLPVDYASIYSEKHLEAALSDDEGKFRMRVSKSSLPIALTISKLGYADTVLYMSDLAVVPDVYIQPKAIELDTFVVRKSDESRFWLARLFVSSRLRAHSRNITRFFATAPFQVALTPGLSTHGKLASKVSNKVSVNIYGGYNGGLDGVEIGGLFNISKGNARYLQVSTTFNLVTGNFTGAQLTGLINQVSGEVRGVQASVLNNTAWKTTNGVQLTALINVSLGGMRGLQLGGFNYARRLQGVQIGLVNVADTSSGFSFGLINFVRKGSGSISLSSSEIAPASLEWRSGNRHLYNFLAFGIGSAAFGTRPVAGFGYGHDFHLNRALKMETQLSAIKVFTSDKSNAFFIPRFQSSLVIRFGNHFSCFLGPAVSLANRPKLSMLAGEQASLSPGFARFNAGGNRLGWVGGNAGIRWHYRE
ncbi:LA_2272 family surface repeat-containing protein [Dyadobacter jiangsuensis]|uniref:Carboxypeptidase-like protein n=1 Tax=Dyadobacter jiangsuensis TaxID=1591085 RepID=A0A2P8GC06_9BACT|nr:hypothetical protein [Dyadobacter jiangsuensis]PSL31504.1 hypothetical protein CLV60_103370 [Dyadobacter jiangsuensis]